MAGSRNYSIGARRPSGGVTDCPGLIIETTLNSPQQDILSTLSIGSILNVSLQVDGSVIVEHNGIVAGALTGFNIGKLTRCLDNGFTFYAEVISIDDGKCDLRISSHG